MRKILHCFFLITHDSPLITFLMVGARRFELPTPCAQGRCATRLRYAPSNDQSHSTQARHEIKVLRLNQRAMSNGKNSSLFLPHHSRLTTHYFLMVGARRFELPTPCAQGRCATRLRYAPSNDQSHSTQARHGIKVLRPNR